ncbi:unnamed protein product, partial [Mesorhabditis belari]|uniref:Cytochrome P450 n=1 Tax=Mesorhabditis belari TaxID=2138241 RepID=A0AAF3J7G1_9BILA
MLFLLTLTVLMLILFYELYWKRRNYPPGPIPLPIFGNLLEIAKAPPGYEAFRKWRKDHGSVFTFWLSFKPIVVIADFDQMRETIVKDGDKFTDRFSFEDFNRFIRGGLYGILTSNGEIWREQRRFTLHTLRDFGMGRNLMETRIMDEVDDLLDRMDRLKNDLNVQKEFGVSVGSVINSVLFGYRFDEQHLHEFHFVKKAIHQILAAEANPFFLVGVAFPRVHQKNHENLNVLFEFIGRQIEERKKTIDFETEDYEDFVECYVKEQIKKKGKENEEFYCNDQLKNLVLDMWVAGMETTSNALNWAICYILNHPEVQEKIHEEFDRVIDSDRKITTNDKNLLPYLNAVVSEVLRFANLLPQNLMRVTVEDTIIAKHLVKKGTAVMPQIGTILYDEKIFPNPHQFNPDRFINADGFKPVFIVADYETIKESIIKEGDKYSDRYVFKEFNEVLRGGTFGLISSQGDLWREQRRFTLHTLRDFGMGRNLMEERIMIEVEPLMERMAQQKEDIFMQKEFDTAVGSIINNIVFGYRFDEQHLDEFELVKKALRHMIVAGTNPIFILSATLPFIRGWPIFRGIYSEVLANNQILFDFIQRQIDNRRKNVDFDTEEYDDFVECWLKEQRKKKGSIHEGYYTDIQLRNLVFDIWIAGMETTSNTLTWAVCYILNYPEVQRKMHEELDRVIKSDRKVTLADKNQLPYINAVVSEIQRLANLLPQNLMRLVTEDAVIKGYKIPAGSAVMPQIATILYDDKIFPDPYILKPERFLNPDGTFKTYPELVPFSVGKRQCPGEGLARMELYLFISNIFQRFKLTATELPSMKKDMGQVVTAKPYFCNVEERH